MAQYNNAHNPAHAAPLSGTTTPGHQKHDAPKHHPPPSAAIHNDKTAPGTDPNTPAASATGGSGAANSQHKRVYQACIPCRRRKVRCDLGSVDNPHDPPCVRCRRESKECFFSATRRKRKTEDDGSDVEEYVIRNGRRRLQGSGPGSPPRYESARRSYEGPDTPASAVGGSNWRSQPLRRPDGSSRSYRDRRNEFEGGDANQTLENLEAQSVMGGQMYGLHDALDLLYKAATDRYVSDPRVINCLSSSQSVLMKHSSPAAQPPPTRHGREDSIVSQPTVASSSAAPAAVNPPPPSIRHQGPIAPDPMKRDNPRHPSISARSEHPVDPDLAAPPVNPSAYADALKAWSRFRFVRAGWFTAQEAIDYID